MNATKGLFKLVAGIILIVAALWVSIAYPGWGRAALDLLQGAIILFVILVGLIVFVIGLTDLKA